MKPIRYIYQKIKNRRTQSLIKNKYQESTGFRPSLQIYPLIFIIRFDTKIGFNMTYFLYYI